MDTPIADFARACAESGSLRLHMPGHKGRALLGPEPLDITEIPGADVLYRAEGIIRKSEENAAALFGSARTVYSAEGSSLCIRAMVYLAIRYAAMTGRRPLIAAGRNAHKTFVTSAALLDAEILWLFSENEADGPVRCDISPEELERVLIGERPAAVYLTSPDYLGNCAALEPLAALCRAHGALLLVDNAHGAYLRFLSESRHPMDLGADICCDSGHKTLPVLTGGAYLHLSSRCPETLREMAETAMGLFAGTSPSYLILQSLDLANRTLAEGYRERLAEMIRRLDALKRQLHEDGWQTSGDEPLKLTILPRSRGYTGSELASLLAERGIRCEFFDPDHLVCMFTPENEADACDRLYRALQGIERRPPLTGGPPTAGRPRCVLSPRQALLSPFETLPVGECLGRVLASPGVSCPPAVPILVCGERIDSAAVSMMEYYGQRTCDVVIE